MAGTHWKIQLLFAVTLVLNLASYTAGMSISGYTQELQSCCEGINTDEECNDACEKVLSQSSENLMLSPTDIHALTIACPSSYTQFWKCFNQSTHNITIAPANENPEDEEHHCCAASHRQTCRDTCKVVNVQHVILTMHGNDPNEAETVELLIEACGEPFGDENDPIWPCFVESEPTPATAPSPQSVDWSRVQCCHRATATECRDSCINLHSGRVSEAAWQTFQLDCVHRSSESDMTTCLADVSAPCTLGCSDLQFCSNFNNRPTESFRHCSRSADRVAKNEFYAWGSEGIILHPLVQVELVISQIQECHPMIWKTVACITQVQPCHSTTHTTKICREDCIELLADCGNVTTSVEDICDIIAPTANEDGCISISQYLNPSPYTVVEASLVDSPCEPSPCAEGFYCTVNHICQPNDLSCTPYSCKHGCPVGKRTALMVPEGSAARVSLLPSGADEDSSCYGYYNCSSVSDGATYIRFGYCESENSCTMGNHSYVHGSKFWRGCNYCTCFHGRVTCTDNGCSGNKGQEIVSHCNTCIVTFAPVCTGDGRTIPNACIARCLGYSSRDYTTGDCESVDPCVEGACGQEEKCFADRHICLGGGRVDCPQHICVPIWGECQGSMVAPVCSASNKQLPSLCALLRTQEEFGYRGYCQADCSRSPSHVVCGVNGETFLSRCQAESLHIAVDYPGPCRALAATSTNGTPCPHVECAPLPSECVGVTPAGACCPQCGAHLTVLMDQSLLSRDIQALGRTFLHSTRLIERLQQHISTLQCYLYVHISLDESLSLLILPASNSPKNNIVVETCIQEGGWLAALINNQAPALTSDPTLSHLTAAHWEAATIKGPPSTDQGRGPSMVPLVIGGSGPSLSLSCCLVWVLSVIAFVVR